MSLSELINLPLSSLAFPDARYTQVCAHSSGLHKARHKEVSEEKQNDYTYGLDIPRRKFLS